MADKLSEKQLLWLKQQLRHGDIRRISRMCGYSSYSIHQFFRGNNSNDEIADAIIRLIEKREDYIKKIARISGITS